MANGCIYNCEASRSTGGGHSSTCPLSGRDGVVRQYVEAERARLLALSPCGHTMAEWESCPICAGTGWVVPMGCVGPIGSHETCNACNGQKGYCRTCREIEEQAAWHSAVILQQVVDVLAGRVPAMMIEPCIDSICDSLVEHTDEAIEKKASAAVAAALDKAEECVPCSTCEDGCELRQDDRGVWFHGFLGDDRSGSGDWQYVCPKAQIRAIPRDSSALDAALRQAQGRALEGAREREEEAVRFVVRRMMERGTDSGELEHLDYVVRETIEDWRKKR